MDKANLSSVYETTIAWAQQRTLPFEGLGETVSTQVSAKHNTPNEQDKFVLYLASHQTAGKGRRENSWLDTGGEESLLSSWSFELHSSPQPIASPRLGLALYNAVHDVWPSLSWSLKAPNDLYLEGKKVAGLLIDAIGHGSQYRLIVGLGFNVLNHPRRFDAATHLSHALTASIEEGEWYQFLDQLYTELQQALPEVTEAKLSESSCTQLLHALNANPNKSESIQEVTQLGDLNMASGRIRWEAL